MKKAFPRSIAGLWILFASGFLTRFWLNNPGIFPDFPEPLAIWLLSLSGLPKGDMAILVGLIVSAIIVSFITLCVWLAIKAIKAL